MRIPTTLFHHSATAIPFIVTRCSPNASLLPGPCTDALLSRRPEGRESLLPRVVYSMPFRHHYPVNTISPHKHPSRTVFLINITSINTPLLPLCVLAFCCPVTNNLVPVAIILFRLTRYLRILWVVPYGTPAADAASAGQARGDAHAFRCLYDCYTMVGLATLQTLSDCLFCYLPAFRRPAICIPRTTPYYKHRALTLLLYNGSVTRCAAYSWRAKPPAGHYQHFTVPVARGLAAAVPVCA